MSETSGEKSFAPSAKRKTDAARKGDVLRSRELSVAVTMLAGAVWLKFAGPWLLGIFSETLRAGFVWDRAAIDHFAPERLLLGLLVLALPPILMLGGVVLAAGLASQMGFGEGRWVGGNLLPKASRLDPMAGLKRMFGPAGRIEIVKGLAKVALLGAIAWFWARAHLPALFALGRGELARDLAQGWEEIPRCSCCWPSGSPSSP